MSIQKLATKIPLKAYDFLFECATKRNITSNTRIAHLLAQVAHESGNFTAVTENLNYSANRLRVIFPKYFTTNQAAAEFANKPERIANRVYANRMGNGNDKSGDGWRFRGRGYLQLTGRTNYKIFSDYVNEDCITNPDLVATKYPMDSAFWFFERNDIWKLCDADTYESVVAVTKKVNGGNHGLADRLTKFRMFMRFLTE